MDTTEEHINKLEDKNNSLTLNAAQQNEQVGIMKLKSRWRMYIYITMLYTRN